MTSNSTSNFRPNGISSTVERDRELFEFWLRYFEARKLRCLSDSRSLAGMDKSMSYDTPEVKMCIDAKKVSLRYSSHFKFLSPMFTSSYLFISRAEQWVERRVEIGIEKPSPAQHEADNTTTNFSNNQKHHTSMAHQYHSMRLTDIRCIRISTEDKDRLQLEKDGYV